MKGCKFKTFSVTNWLKYQFKLIRPKIRDPMHKKPY